MAVMQNINTIDYWNGRFASGHWETCGGRAQTSAFALAQAELLTTPATFDGTLLDFGCGLGDAFPVYRKRFPFCTLIGVDHSAAAVQRCRDRFGHIASFICGDATSVPKVDIIIASNVFEHLTDDEAVARTLLDRCRELYVFVPYQESPLCSEHVNRYDEHSFSSLPILESKTFYSRGWSQYGRDLWVGVHLKNLLRPLFGRRRIQRRKQIMFRMRGALYR
jgi:SAM-dependent methyltransferase